MSTESSSGVMNIESLQMKIENQQNIVKQLSNENEELYQQYSHLMIRNNKLLKRIDDLQGIIDDLHIRIEELQLISGNMLKLNDRIKHGNENALVQGDQITLNYNSEKINDDIKKKTEFNNVFSHWKNYPGQDARNEPNLRKQSQMLVHLYYHKALRAADLFSKSGVGGVTGARYVSTLKKFGLIQYTGARKKGQYVMTPKGVEFIENAIKAPIQPEESFTTHGDSGAFQHSKYPVIEQEGIPLKKEAVEAIANSFNQPDV